MTYRSRLLLYAGMLIVLLTGMMTLSFKTARDVIVTVTREHLADAVAYRAEALDAQGDELRRFAALVAGDPLLRQYLRGAGTEGRPPPERLAQFADGLADAVVLVLPPAGATRLPEPHQRLVDAVRRRGVGDEPELFFIDIPPVVTMVALHPVRAAGTRLGTALVARALDRKWLITQEGPANDYLLLFAKRGKVLLSNDARFDGADFDAGTGQLDAGNRQFRMLEIRYVDTSADLPGLWFGMAAPGVTRLLSAYQRWVLSFAVLGALAVLLVGWLMVRNFSRPMAALMLITEQMMKGELPVMSRSQPKSEMDRLVNRFADMLDCLRKEQSKLENANRKLQETAITDSLTGLYNRRYLQEVTPGLLAQVVRDQRYLTAVLIDLDHFKTINDSLGHLGGDAVLAHFAQLLQHNSRVNDFLFRIGGEEFLILNVAESPAASVTLAEKIRELVSCSPATYQDSTVAVSVSIGVSCCYGQGGDLSLSMLMRAADKALYEAKSTGRNRVVLHASCRDAARFSRPRSQMTLIDGGHGGKPRS